MDTITVASKELGVTSDINGKVNPRVLDYFAKIGATYEPGDDGVWCAAFVGFVLETCGIHSTRALNARSYLKWGTAEQSPKQGDVVIFWRDSVDSANGHVSFFHHDDGDHIYCLGGNQGSGIVDIERYPKNRVLGYRTITTNQNKTMEPTTEPINVTPETAQVLTINKVTVTFTKTVDGQVTGSGEFDLAVTPAIVEAVQAAQEPGFNITVQ